MILLFVSFWWFLDGFVTYADAIIPEGYIVLPPLEAHMRFLGCGNEFIEIINDGIAFSFGYPDDLSDKARVEEDGFPAGDRMCAN